MLFRRPIQGCEPMESHRTMKSGRLPDSIPVWFLVETMVTTIAIGALMIDLKQVARLAARSRGK